MTKFKRITSTLVAAIVITAMLGGCAFQDMMTDIFSGDEPQSVGVERQEKNEISNSISVGIIDFDTFNPLLTGSETVKECLQFVYEPLFDVDEALRPVPVLAESYTISPDGRTIDITMRSDVTWHDGSAFTAYDAAYTIKQIRSGITPYTASLANLADYKATGDYSLQLVLNYSVPDAVSMLSFPIVKYQSDMKVNSNYIPVGTGPFYYVSQPSNEKVVFSAYEGYHGGRAQIDTLNAFIIPDFAKYESMFEASEIDLITGKTIDLSEYTPRGSAKNNEYITNKLTYIGFNTQDELLFGNQTRRALAELVDKDSIVNSTIYSKGVAVDIPINPASIYYYDVATKFKRDESLALELLGNEGWGVNANGEYVRTLGTAKQTLSIELLVEAENAERVSIAEKIAKDYTDFGIKTKVTALPYEEFTARIGAKNYDMMIGEIEITPNMDLTPLVSSAGNMFSYANPDTDTLMGQMGMTQDEEQLKELYKQYGSQIIDDMPFAALFFRKGDVLSTSKIKSEVVPTITREYRNTESWSVIE